MPQIPTVTYKVLILGEHKVGKTALVKRFSKPKEEFSHALLPTIGIDYVTVHSTVDGLQLKVQLWDTVGQERFRTMTRLYYRGAKGILLVYDVTCKDTFLKVSEWIKDLKEYSLDNETLFLVGNKIDLIDDRCVTTKQGADLASSYGLKYYETSALTSENVNETFNQLMVNMKDSNNPFEVGSTHIIDGDEWEELFSKNPVIHKHPKIETSNNKPLSSSQRNTKAQLSSSIYEQKSQGRCCY